MIEEYIAMDIQLTNHQRVALYHDAHLRALLADKKIQERIHNLLEVANPREREHELLELERFASFRELRAELEHALLDE